MGARPPRILAIAGSDSSGGAGIQADIKTITMLGGYAMTAITAVTAQDTKGVHAVEVLSPELVTSQIEACASDIGIDAVKIGMLGSAAIALAVADVLEGSDFPVVFDPVMIATSGSSLADDDTVAAFERLIALATLTTPNLPELSALGGLEALRPCTANLLVKGGHLDSERIEDVLYTPHAVTTFSSDRIDTRHTHGTGCTLASAIATGLGAGMRMDRAVDRAIRFVGHVLAAAPEIGEGNGPMGHAMGRVPFYELLAAIDPDGWDTKSFAARWS
jgi:hydroxymethylpyrimidine/phosphomethylpyrimidine kinase